MSSSIIYNEEIVTKTSERETTKIRRNTRLPQVETWHDNRQCRLKVRSEVNMETPGTLESLPERDIAVGCKCDLSFCSLFSSHSLLPISSWVISCGPPAITQEQPTTTRRPLPPIRTSQELWTQSEPWNVTSSTTTQLRALHPKTCQLAVTVTASRSLQRLRAELSARQWVRNTNFCNLLLQLPLSTTKGFILLEMMAQLTALVNQIWSRYFSCICK